MSRTLELAEPVYDALLKAAEATGETPERWIAAQLERPESSMQEASRPKPDENGFEKVPPPSDSATPEESIPAEKGENPAPRTLADMFEGYIGLIHSDGQDRLSEDTGEKFTDYLEAKRRAGHL